MAAAGCNDTTQTVALTLCRRGKRERVGYLCQLDARSHHYSLTRLIASPCRAPHHHVPFGAVNSAHCSPSSLISPRPRLLLLLPPITHGLQARSPRGRRAAGGGRGVCVPAHVPGGPRAAATAGRGARGLQPLRAVVAVLRTARQESVTYHYQPPPISSPPALCCSSSCSETGFDIWLVFVLMFLLGIDCCRHQG